MALRVPTMGSGLFKEGMKVSRTVTALLERVGDGRTATLCSSRRMRDEVALVAERGGWKPERCLEVY